MTIEWRRRPFFFAAILFSGAICLSQIAVPPQTARTGQVQSLLKDEPAPYFLGGRIVSEVETREFFGDDKRTYFILETERLWRDAEHDGEELRGRVRVSWKKAPKDLAYADALVLEGDLASFKGRRNPGGFDAKSYWSRQNIDAAFFADPLSRFRILSRGKGNVFVRKAIRLKQDISRRISSDFEPREAAFLKALFLGEKSDLDQDFKDLFLRTGTMHLLAVSGFNIGFLSAVLWILLRILPIPRNIKLGMLLAAVWSYCLVVGWQAPVARAAVMATVIVLGNMLGRKSDGLNNLGLAACMILALNPKQLFDVGFQLSFIAVLGLITAVPVFLKRPVLLPHEKFTVPEKARFYFEELFWVSFVSLFITLPITVQNFYILTPYAVLANLVVAPLTFLLFLLGVPYLFISQLLPAVLWAALYPIKFVIACVVSALFLIENIPGAVLVVGTLEPWLWSALAAGIGAIFFLPRWKTSRGRALFLIIFCAGIFTLGELRRNSTHKFVMTQLDVGQGDAAFFEFPDGRNLLVDAGSGRFSDKGRWVINPFLRSKGIRQLDGVVITHPQEDHAGGLISVLEEVRVQKMFHAGFAYQSPRWQAVEGKIAEEKAIVMNIGRGSRIGGYQDIRIQVLHPDLDGSADPNINNESVVFKLEYGDVSFLMTGDIQKKAMEALLESGEDLSADVLKVPHHGARMDETGKRFVEAVSPNVSLISCGERNPFGHPSETTLDILTGVPGNRVLRTDRMGAISIRSDGNRMILD